MKYSVLFANISHTGEFFSRSLPFKEYSMSGVYRRTGILYLLCRRYRGFIIFFQQIQKFNQPKPIDWL